MDFVDFFGDLKWFGRQGSRYVRQDSVEGGLCYQCNQEDGGVGMGGCGFWVFFCVCLD